MEWLTVSKMAEFKKGKIIYRGGVECNHLKVIGYLHLTIIFCVFLKDQTLDQHVVLNGEHKTSPSFMEYIA